jgi:hypothetical protein
MAILMAVHTYRFASLTSITRITIFTSRPLKKKIFKNNKRL